MKLAFVLLAWLALFAGLLILRFGLKSVGDGTRDALLNVANGFVNVFRGLAMVDMKGRSNCSPTVGETVGLLIGLCLISIPMMMLWDFFCWTVEWARAN